MIHYYSYEYGWANAGDSTHVYRSRDGLIGLRVRNRHRKGGDTDGYSRFFIWDDDSIELEFERELQARAFLAASKRNTSRSRYRGSTGPSESDYGRGERPVNSPAARQ